MSDNKSLFYKKMQIIVQFIFYLLLYIYIYFFKKIFLTDLKYFKLSLMLQD